METALTFILWFIGTLALLTLVEMLMRIGVNLEPEIPFANDDVESETKARPNPISRLLMWIMIFIVCMLLAGVVMKYGETNRPPDGNTAPPPERPEGPLPEVTRTPSSELPQESEPITTAAGTRIDEVIPGLAEFFKRPLPKIPEEEEVARSPKVGNEPGVSSERSTLEYFKPSTSQPDPRLAEVHDSHIYAGQVKFEYGDYSDTTLVMNTHTVMEGSRAMVAATHWEDPYPTFLMDIVSDERYATFLEELANTLSG